MPRLLSVTAPIYHLCPRGIEKVAAYKQKAGRFSKGGNSGNFLPEDEEKWPYHGEHKEDTEIRNHKL